MNKCVLQSGQCGAQISAKTFLTDSHGADVHCTLYSTVVNKTVSY